MSDHYLTVELGSRTYPIINLAGILDDTASLQRRLDSATAELQDGWSRLASELRDRRGLLISDQNVADLYLPQAQLLGKALGLHLDHLVLPAGEASKSIECLDKIWNHCSTAGHSRRSVIVALGGGVVGDLAGFAAASFMRGIDWIQIPTTLMAQVDSSVGGKTGINLAGGKNLVGAFWQPRGVLIDPQVLRTLSDREFRAGLAEVVKYAVIMDDDFFGWLVQHAAAIMSRDLDAMTRLITHCCRLKAAVVGDDERELSGRRAILNYGHTFGHALETVWGYGHWLHGEAVACGMTLAMQTAVRLGLVDQQAAQQQLSLLQEFQLPTCWLTEPATPSVRREWAGRMISAMQRDKKNDGQNVRLILPKGADAPISISPSMAAVGPTAVGPAIGGPTIGGPTLAGSNFAGSNLAGSVRLGQVVQVPWPGDAIVEQVLMENATMFPGMDPQA